MNFMMGGDYKGALLIMLRNNHLRLSTQMREVSAAVF
jgi:hypothetical protein